MPKRLIRRRILEFVDQVQHDRAVLLGTDGRGATFQAFQQLGEHMSDSQVGS